MDRSVFDDGILGERIEDERDIGFNAAPSSAAVADRRSDPAIGSVLAPIEWLAGAAVVGSPAPGADFGRVAEGELDQPLGGSLKRLIDMLGALAACSLLLPLALAIVLLVACAGGGPAIYVQTRVGFRGVPFRCFKFRTMIADGDAVLARHLASSPAAAREWSDKRKLTSDPRVTGIGRLLRRTSLDELPQLINVLRGEMSLVGPRPVVADELERYGVLQNCYLRVRPGLTGLWQVSGRSRISYDARIELDRAYVQHWSVRQDLMIMLSTIPAVLRLDEAG